MLVNAGPHPATTRGSGGCAGGFTLIELIVTIAILAIVSTVAAPSFNSFIGTMRAKSAAFDLISDLSIARSEAIGGNRTVTVAPVGGDWANGWAVVANARVGPPAVAAATVRERAALSSSLSIGVAPVAGVTFLPNGRMPNDATAQNAAWSISSSISGVTPRCVVVTANGSARSKMGSC
jgi:type IV fimbrial biogenesis protein FimT